RPASGHACDSYGRSAASGFPLARGACPAYMGFATSTLRGDRAITISAVPSVRFIRAAPDVRSGSEGSAAMTRCRVFSNTLFCTMAVLAVRDVAAQTAFPSKNITIVVPFAPGGSSDLITRILAKELTA